LKTKALHSGIAALRMRNDECDEILAPKLRQWQHFVTARFSENRYTHRIELRTEKPK